MAFIRLNYLGVIQSSYLCFSWKNSALDLKEGHTVGPIILFPKTRSGQVAILSPFSDLLKWSMFHDKDQQIVSFGMQGKTNVMPSEYQPYWMIYYGNEGVNKAFMDWGKILKTYHQTNNDVYRENDLTANYLGYWTDNGGCYYYYTEGNKTYEDTIIDVKKYADSIRVPYK